MPKSSRRGAPSAVDEDVRRLEVAMDDETCRARTAPRSRSAERARGDRAARARARAQYVVTGMPSTNWSTMYGRPSSSAPPSRIVAIPGEPAGECLAFNAETPHHLDGAISRTQHLERDRLRVGAVRALGAIDVAHSAGADRALDAIRADARAVREHAVQARGCSASIARDETAFGDQAGDSCASSISSTSRRIVSSDPQN